MRTGSASAPAGDGYRRSRRRKSQTSCGNLLDGFFAKFSTVSPSPAGRPIEGPSSPSRGLPFSVRGHSRQTAPPRSSQGRFCASPEAEKSSGRIHALEGLRAQFSFEVKWRETHEGTHPARRGSAEEGTRRKDPFPPAPGRSGGTRPRLLPTRHGQAEDVPALRGCRGVGPEAPPPAE